MYIRLPGIFSTNHPHLPAAPSSSTTPCWGQCCEECELVFVAVIIAGPCAIPSAVCMAHNQTSLCQVESLL